MTRYASVIAASLVLAIGLSTANAAIIFDNFNVDEGHFGLAPTFSGTSVGEAASSTADRVTTDSPLEGAGHQKLVLNSDGSATLLRIRHLSGGGSPGGASGQPANTPFTTTGGVDGRIGYYLKTNVLGMETQINLDGAANDAASMRGSPSTPIIGDGQWHLYEWDLDLPIWGSIPGIATHTTGALPNNTYTIDSIYFRDPSGTPSPSGTYFLDFVAKSDAGSIAALLNSPPTVVDAEYFNVNASDPGSLTHQFTATDTETPTGPFTWTPAFPSVSYTPNYGGSGTGPANPATLSSTGEFNWNSVGSPRGDYVWTVTATDPGGLSDNGTITVHVTHVPEPASLALAGLGLVAIVVGCRRQNTQGARL